MAVEIPATSCADDPLSAQFQCVRSRSLEICEPLETEDYQVQPMDDASPPKWHLAHTSWFFETFLLKPFAHKYEPFDSAYEYLFNSYYNGVGAQFPRPKRGFLSRPTVQQVKDYRAHVDHHMGHLLSADLPEDALFRVVLGLHHEEQHQELMFTDMKYNFGNNPLFPAYHDKQYRSTKSAPQMTFSKITGGNHQIGTDAPSVDRFVFDNESPRHTVFVGHFQIADRLVTNGEFLEFIQDGGYKNPDLWLSDAWGLITGSSGFFHPLYWVHKDDA